MLCVAGASQAHAGVCVAKAEAGTYCALPVSTERETMNPVMEVNLLYMYLTVTSVFVLSSKQKGSSEDWVMFHMMCRILEATEGLCLPLPPGRRDPSSSCNTSNLEHASKIPESLKTAFFICEY